MRIFNKIAALLATAMVMVIMVAPINAGAYEYFEISEYNVYLNVNENNSMDVVETITANFSTPRHGIYRDIEYRGTFERDVEGEILSSKYWAKIKHVDVENRPFDVSTEGPYKRVKIGDPDRYVEGQQVYTISYTIDFGDDGIGAFDDVYFNLIGTNWDTIIHHATMQIQLPKAFDESQLGFTSGAFGSISSEDITYTVDGNTILAETTSQLSPYEGVTMRLILPEGYFVNERVPINWKPWVYGLCGIMIIGAWLLWLKYGKDNPIFPTVEFNPPNDLPPAEVGYIVDGIVETRDVISMLLYWADKGYIELKEEGKRKFLMIKKCELPKTAQYYERIMFSEMFACGQKMTLSGVMDMFKMVLGGGMDEIQDKLASIQADQEEAAKAITVVSTKDLENRFYQTIEKVETLIREKYKRSEETSLFTNSSIGFKVLVGLGMSIPMIVGLIVALKDNMEDFAGAIVTAVLLGSLVETVLIILSFTVQKRRSMSKTKWTVSATFLFILLGIASGSGFLVAGVFGNEWLLGGVAIASTLIIGWFFIFMDKRTKQSNELLAKIMGLKQFIETAEKDRLETMIQENPDYFYHVLSYAYVLGVTNVWAKRFKNIDVKPPNWYTSRTAATMFTTTAFTSSLSNSMRMVQSSSSAPSSSGSSSSGGSSGGGGGGGGGGSW